MKKEVNLNIKRRGILSRIFSRATLFSLLFPAQIVLVILFAVEFAHYYQVYYWLDVIFRLAALIVMLFKKSVTPYKVTWLIIITLFSILGAAISLIKAKHSKLKEDELPEHTIFSIMTDGLENASKEYSYKRIKEMIELQKKCGWEFIFQAANIDTEYEAERLGIDKDMAMSFDADSVGVGMVMKCCCAKISDSRRKPRKKNQ